MLKINCCKSFQELNPILKIADSLRIRGLSTSTSVPASSDDVMMMTDTDKDHHEEHQIIHASFPNSKPSKKSNSPLVLMANDGLSTLLETAPSQLSFLQRPLVGYRGLKC